MIHAALRCTCRNCKLAYVAPIHAASRAVVNLSMLHEKLVHLFMQHVGSISWWAAQEASVWSAVGVVDIYQTTRIDGGNFNILSNIVDTSIVKYQSPDNYWRYDDNGIFVDAVEYGER